MAFVENAERNYDDAVIAYIAAVRPKRQHEQTQTKTLTMTLIQVQTLLKYSLVC
ncbi:MAG: hypothetical protein ACLTCP_03320 [Ruminococcus bicirculans (ex Wegman et al. 2014)]